MVSTAVAKRPSATAENTGSGSRSPSGRSSSRHSGLSSAASPAIVSQTSATKELGNGLHRPLDLPLSVGERDEERLELRRGDVDPAREQVPEESAVAVGVAALGLLEVRHRAVRAEERRHRADTLDDARASRGLAEARLQPGSSRLERLVAGRIP